MAIERGRLIEIGVSAGAVGGFVVVLIAIGVLFKDDTLSATGGIALVGAIAAFLLLMAGIGYVLAGRTSED